MTAILLLAAITTALASVAVLASPPTVARAQSSRAHSSRAHPVCALAHDLEVLGCKRPWRGHRTSLIRALRRALVATTKTAADTVVHTKRSATGLVHATADGLQDTLASTSELLPETGVGCDARALVRGRACGHKIPALIETDERDEEILADRFGRRPTARPVERARSTPAAALTRARARPEPRSVATRQFGIAKPQDDSDHRPTEEVVEALRRFAFPLTLAVLVIAFLAVQGRLDRKDPKLALAPVTSGQELLSFQ